MNKTTIEYLDYTWNPLAMRCTPVSEGCRDCWHIQRANMLAKNPLIPEHIQKAYAGGLPVLIESRLEEPLKVKKPSIIGVQFMGDLFHEDVKFEWIRKVIVQTLAAPRHIYLFLTKRPERMKHIFTYFSDVLQNNCWLGVTCENQQRADERIPILLQIPAAVRFVSIEPMLGPVDLTFINPFDDFHTDALDTPDPSYKLHWLILGGETGPGARPMHPDWARSVRDQCQAAGVPFFMKQMARKEPIPEDLMIREYPDASM